MATLMKKDGRVFTLDNPIHVEAFKRNGWEEVSEKESLPADSAPMKEKEEKAMPKRKKASK